jgi:hypothetical protein
MKNKENIGIIYCDMDGVLVDFLAGAEKVLGHHFDAPYNDKKDKIARKAKIASHDNFWADLPPMKDFKTLWKVIDKYDAHILTAYAEWDSSSIEGKKLWVKKHLNLPMDRFHAVKREEKQDYTKDGDKKNILIDDYIKNIKEFDNADGIGIHHVSARVSLLKLRELGFH